MRLIQRHRLPPLPFLLALATAANTGSVATLVGNPQNMLCATLGGLAYRHHLLLLGPVAVVGLAVNHALLLWVFRRELRSAALATGALASPPPPAPLEPADSRGDRRHRRRLHGSAPNLAWSATAGFVALMLLHRRDTRQLWGRIDWSLLLFFCGLFVVVEGLVRSGLPAAVFARYPLAVARRCLGGLRAGVFLIGSNVVSNVPFILVVRDQMATLPDPRLAWELLAMASTFAGNLTLLGSVANIIVAESAREIGGIGFWDYLKVGVPLALLTTAMGTGWLCLVG